MNLNPNEPFEFALGYVVVDDFAHDMAVEDVDEHIATHDEVILVPIIRLDKGLEIVGVAETAIESGEEPIRCTRLSVQKPEPTKLRPLLHQSSILLSYYFRSPFTA